jgi:hypothetical protein
VTDLMASTLGHWPACWITKVAAAPLLYKDGPGGIAAT